MQNADEVMVMSFAERSCDYHVTLQLDKLKEEGPGGGALVPLSRHSPNMEASVLLHNIQRIMQASQLVYMAPPTLHCAVNGPTH